MMTTTLSQEAVGQPTWSKTAVALKSGAVEPTRGAAALTTTLLLQALHHPQQPPTDEFCASKAVAWSGKIFGPISIASASTCPF